MVQLAIRCHPRVPISTDELEGWLEIEVKDLRAQAPHATVRLSRLTQALRDMHLLGLQPTLLAPSPPASHTHGQAA
jgi:hypothetical protein